MENRSVPLFKQLYPQYEWETDSLKDPAIRQRDWILERTRKRQYPARLLRYWFVYHFLRELGIQKGRGLNVTEVGIDVGQMREFVSTASQCHPEDAPQIESWNGVDMKVKREALEGLGYTSLTEARIEDAPDFLDKETDVVILLHILEHLYAPEEAMSQLSSLLKPGAMVFGGLPSLPHFLVAKREAKIRANPNSNGHVSAFSPKRMRDLADTCGFSLDFLSGAFMVRASGNRLEDHGWWLNFNLHFAQMFPDWPGETYWVLRKK
jgi:SAM-dependent methyltransferase